MSINLLKSCGTWTVAIVAVASIQARAQSAQPTAPKAGVVATVSATGCLEKWTPAASDTGKAPDGVQFVLSRIDGHTASATSADAGKTEKTPPAARYLLLSQPAQNLAAHLNHRVKIDGTIAPQPTEGASLAENLSNPAARETNLPEGPESKSYRDNLVEVLSLTMVAKSCGQ